ncbi:MAG: hypothetical protein LBQ64_06105 [Bacteroidales bacterium]|jgi:hypothetical protein|nr:hypothetical protein [Bacteroidales bacterium]
MKNTLVVVVLIYFISMSSIECSGQETPAQSSSAMALPPTVVYKAKKKYDKKVAITLSDDKKSITSYPHPSDVSASSYPTPLKKGYRLDNRGIGKNTAFISLTYEEYAALQKVPSLSELYGMIIDKDPVKAMYDCRNCIKNADLVHELNRIIDEKFKDCRRIK